MPCSGGFKLRWRVARDTSAGKCPGPWAQTESCNMGSCPGNQYPSIPRVWRLEHWKWPLRGIAPIPCSGGLEWKRGSAGGGVGKSVPSSHFYFWTGESCETRDTVFTLDCANQCPRSCADLWDGVQCLQGPCSPGIWPGESALPLPRTCSP